MREVRGTRRTRRTRKTRRRKPNVKIDKKEHVNNSRTANSRWKPSKKEYVRM